MKKMVIITGIVLIVCTFMSAAAAYQEESQIAQSSIVYNEKQIEASADQITKDNEVYVLKAENGKLVVYVKGESKPYMEIDRAVSSLPQGDVLRLEKGIEISGKENLKKSIEDYCS